MTRRKPREIATVAAKYERRRVSLTLTRPQREAIDRLLETGLFGLSTADFLRRAIDAQLRANLAEGWAPTIFPPAIIVERKSRRR